MTRRYATERGRLRLAALATCALALALPLAACGGDASRSTTVSQTKTVSDMLDERTQDADAGVSTSTGSGTGTATATSGNDDAPTSGAGTTPSAGGGASAAASSDVDIDLTTMSADMVYATVNNMVTKPASYTGKTVRMAGPLYHQYYDKTDTTYHYVVIEDATACCAQGIEFVMGDGKQDEPDYPAEGTRVTVTGTFEPYLEDGTQYVHLVRSSLVLG